MSGQPMSWADVRAALQAGAPPADLLPLARGLLEAARAREEGGEGEGEENKGEEGTEKKEKAPMAKMYQRLPESKEVFQLVYLRPPLSLFERFGEKKEWVFDGELTFDLLEGFKPRFIKEFDRPEHPHQESNGSPQLAVGGGPEAQKGNSVNRMLQSSGISEWNIFEDGYAGKANPAAKTFRSGLAQDGLQDMEQNSEGVSVEELHRIGETIWHSCVEPAVNHVCNAVGMAEFQLARALEAWQWGVIVCAWEDTHGPLSVEVFTQCVRVMDCGGLADFVLTGALPSLLVNAQANKTETLDRNLRNLIDTAFDLSTIKELSAREFKQEMDNLALKTCEPVGSHAELLLYTKFAEVQTCT